MKGLAWKSRSRHDQTELAKRRTWSTADGRYLVIESVPLVRGMTRIYYAIRQEDRGQAILGKHRTRHAAEQRCELDARAQEAMA